MEGKEMTYILVPFSTLTIYLLFSFVQWDLNAGNWATDIRFAAAVFMAVIGGLTLSTAASLEADK